MTGGRRNLALAVGVSIFVAAAIVTLAIRLVVAAPLIADLSQHLIKITTGFSGTDVLLFGATDGPGDVIVVVRGPREPLVVRRKVRVAGIWVNGAQVKFPDAPAYYAVASSAPVQKLLDGQSLERHQIGAERLTLTPDREFGETPDLGTFRRALIRLMTRRGLYRPSSAKIRFLGGQLFRVDMYFPANVPTGSYTVEVMLVRGGRVVGAQTTPLFVNKDGIGADMYDFAHFHSILYGLAAIVIALVAGWLASVVFGRS